MTKSFAQDKKCVEQKVNTHNSVMCVISPGLFQHDIYALFVDKQLIFNIVDDFAENVELTHTIPEGMTLELPMSENKKGNISLVGGCVPISEKGAEIARMCNFSWGNLKIVDEVRFDFD